ncbi:hypothetical protein [Pseudonocardia ailaonensis]|uniref:hypothetical protein n=1 Tax=Pseudonocardia ailaonensis TaxID=367279 RepID=UPI0031CFA6C3
MSRSRRAPAGRAEEPPAVPSPRTADGDGTALPRRRKDTVIPPPREPEGEQERAWATDVPTLRRLAEGLRRRLR